MTCPYTCPVAAQQEQTRRRSSKPNQAIPTTTSSVIHHKKRMTVVTDLSNLNQYGKRRLMGHNKNNNNAADLDILGGKSAWENVDRTTIFCSKCAQQVLAYFVQIQIRSADEPMTIFYKCSMCQFQWNE
jgi:DNA-directed RNA polymerase subunit M/transcription elongation factor TFIIS